MNRFGEICACVAFAALVVAGANPVDAGGTFIRFDGVKGESKDIDHEDWCDMVSFSHSAREAEVSATGPARRRGGVVMDDVVVSKVLDKASPKLAEAVTKGKVFPKVEIHFVTDRTTYFEYELTNVTVTSYSIGGPSSAVDPLMEEVALRFEKIKVTYSEIDDTGRVVGKVEFSWSASDGLR
jgi:type VI secretion system secreted protein Hcp